MFESLGIALQTVARPEVIFYMLFGTAFGWILGVIPGLGGIQGVILLIPFAYKLDPMAAMYLYAAVLGSCFVGGSVSAILIGVPGTGSNVATCFDGYPLTKKGKGVWAIGVSVASSAMGTFLSIFMVVALLPVAQQVVLAFGPPEMFMLVALGLCATVVISRGNMIKGLMSACLGLTLSFVGQSNMTGLTRYTLGTMYLTSGIALVPFFIGLFGISQVVKLASEGGMITSGNVPTGGRLRDALDGVRESFSHWGCMVRSSIIGTVIGIIPGIGGAVANLLAYVVALQVSSKPETYGKGNPEGVVAPESANHATQPGALLTVAAFGVPGSVEMAVMMGVFVLYGLNPGPKFLQEQAPIFWAIIVGFAIADVLSNALTLFLASRMAIVTRINLALVVPVIAVFSLMGVYIMSKEMLDVFLAFGIGIFSLGLEKYKFSLVPVCLGFILGPYTEISFQQSLMMSWGDYTVFFTRPISLALLCVILFMLSFPFWIDAVKKSREVAIYEAE